MSREVHVRICERLGVRFPRATRLVVNFQYQRAAEAFHKNLTDRFGKFGLELAEEKTRVMRFGRLVRADLVKTGEKRAG
jgi:hypothetical protein